ncbi:hypothetical protein FQA39_LY18137 [Lamprigera yunnana]|nr:hypothetical protein FQA39_LY18137 [Lamprigera yunnana]
MEGFYYDARIVYMTEIIKNGLYFAVLEGEENRVLKNTQEIFYFSIDDELLYFNYYFDFGPLNISCLYKYCYKLNNYLRFVSGSKRVIHYTTSNPVKRVNAAYLMGCYTIIYLKMNPKDIYKILFHAGGTFKQFVDASQSVSHYTINLLNCFNAIHKALEFNFFNFSDFDVVEYDTYDKLQNGDMNWLLPRKFLAFIGPTDSISGHPPDHYIKYFLQNDIKTVIRLNNKVYDASAFTKAGIDHHELFFPDGTIPAKQVLLTFLHLSETARAAIAVHCKAGLGRTGSLIGSYLIKHYQMSAHEAIAWMRICRPGSVIGQQQGWLEKIESWLWRQGRNYRFEHFGDGDKILHHKYGIYSKVWPLEREKLILHVQRKKKENNDFQRPHSTNTLQRCNFHNVPQVKSSTTKNRKHQKIINTLKYDDKSYQRLKPSQKKNSVDHNLTNLYDIKNNIDYAQEYLNRTIKTKKLLSASKFKDKIVPNIPKYDISQKSEGPPTTKSYQTKLRKRNQSEGRDHCVEKNDNSRVQRSFLYNVEQTQGDKLNEIKAKRMPTYYSRRENQYKTEPDSDGNLPVSQYEPEDIILEVNEHDGIEDGSAILTQENNYELATTSSDYPTWKKYTPANLQDPVRLSLSSATVNIESNDEGVNNVAPKVGLSKNASRHRPTTSIRTFTSSDMAKNLI